MIIFHKFMNVKINLLLCHTQPPLSFVFKFISSTIRFSLFNWSRVDLQCCISFRCTEKWFRYIWASLVAQKVNDLPATQKTQARSLGWEDPLEKGIATHSSILAWRIPWTEEPGGPQSTGSQRVGHDWATKRQQQYIHNWQKGNIWCSDKQIWEFTEEL